MKKKPGSEVKILADKDFAPLARWQRWLCWLILRLEYIPAYRRYYRIDNKTHQPDEKPEWRFSWHGLWGFHLLMRLGFFWRYIGPFHIDEEINIVEDFGPTPPWLDKMKEDLEGGES